MKKLNIELKLETYFLWSCIPSENDEHMSTSAENGRKIRFLSSNNALVEEGISEMQKKQMMKYWGRKGRRYSEAEKAFLNRVRLPDAINETKKKNPGWFSYCDPGSKWIWNNTLGLDSRIVRKPNIIGRAI